MDLVRCMFSFQTDVKSEFSLYDSERKEISLTRKNIPFIRKFAKWRTKFVIRTTLVHLHANVHVCVRCRWLLEWAEDVHRSHEKFCLRFMVDQMTYGSVCLFMAFYFNHAVYFNCMVKSFASTLNSIWFSSQNVYVCVCYKVGEWTELWFYAQHPHEAEFFLCVYRYT